MVGRRRRGRPKDSVAHLGVEDGGAYPFGRGAVGIRPWDLLDQPVDAEPAQVVSHLVGAVVRIEEPGYKPAKASIGEAGDGVDDTAQSAGQGHGAWIPEAQGSGSLALPYVGLVKTVEQIVSDGTALTGTLNCKQTGVDLAAFRHQLGQMLEPGEDPDVRRLVDDGLDAIRPPFLQVLFHPAVLVGEVHLHLGSGAEHPGPELLGRRTAAPVAAKHGMDLFGPTDADVVRHERLEEPPRPSRVVQHERARHLDLAHRELPPVARRPVRRGERCRDGVDPPVEEPLHVVGPEPAADLGQLVRVVAGGEPVGQRRVADPRMVELAFGPLMPVAPDLFRIGEVRADLE